MMLPRPNYTKLDPFFCKKGGVYIFQSKAFFLGSCRSLFWALGGYFCDPWTRYQFWGGISKNEGGFKERISCRAPVKIKDNLYMHALSMWFICNSSKKWLIWYQCSYYHATDGSYCLVHFSQEDDSMDNSIELPLSLIDPCTDRKSSCDQFKFK